MGLLDRIFGRSVESIAPAAPDPRLLEGLYDVGGDPDAHHTAAQMGASYVRRLTTAHDRDLSPILQSRMLELVYWLYDSNAVAKRILELTKDFIIGDGVSVLATGKTNDPNIQAIQRVLDRFWHDPVNQMDLRVHRMALELGLTGEGIYTAAVNPIDGHVRLGTIDPALVSEVIVDPANCDLVTDVVIGRGYGDDQRFKVIRVTEDPRSRTYGRLAGVETDAGGQVIETFTIADGSAKPYAGACFFFKVNAVSGARRGRSDLLPVADWIDAVDQVLMNEVDRTALLKNFIWDVTLTGAGDEDIRRFIKENGPPKPGSLRVHNEKIAWQAVTPDLKPIDAQLTVDLLMQAIASGVGLPKTWLNTTENVNRATAAELGEPSFKRLEARQRFFREILTVISRFVLDQAELHGRLPRRPTQAGSLQPEPWPIVVETPAMRTNDVSKLAGALREVGQGLMALRQDKAIDVQVEQEAAALILAQLGLDVDLDDMRRRLEAEEARAADRDRLAPYGVSALAPSVNGQPPVPAVGEPPETVVT